MDAPPAAPAAAEPPAEPPAERPRKKKNTNFSMMDAPASEQAERLPRKAPRKSKFHQVNFQASVSTEAAQAQTGSRKSQKSLKSKQSHALGRHAHRHARGYTTEESMRSESDAALDNDGVTPLRRKLQDLLANTYVDIGLSMVIVANVVLMVAETNHKALCDDPEDKAAHIAQYPQCSETSTQTVSLNGANLGFQVIYTIECVFRLYAYRWSFFKSRWNLLDITIVVLGYLDMILVQVLSGKEIPGPGVAILRIFRIARLLRVARILSFFPELYVMIRGFVGAMMAMFWGMFMIACLLLIWSILAVELIHPTSKTFDEEAFSYCKTSFSAVETCMLIFFQTVFAGDSWGACAIPIIKAQPGLFFIFAGTLITIQLGFTNLVLAVIVERATKATEKDKEEVAKEKQKKHEENSARLHGLISGLDKDGSGTISWEELEAGYDDHDSDLATTFHLLEIDKLDLEKMFSLLADDEEVVDFNDLVDNLESCESEDLRRATMLMSLQLTRIREDMRCVKEREVHRKRQTQMALPHADMNSQLQAVQQEVRSCLNETLHGLETSLETQWHALEHNLNRQVQVQLRTLSQHTDMLSGIAAATGSTVAEPKDIDIEVGYANVERMRSRGSLFDNEKKGIFGTESSVPAKANKLSKQSAKKEKEGQGTRNAARWKDRAAQNQNSLPGQGIRDRQG